MAYKRDIRAALYVVIMIASTVLYGTIGEFCDMARTCGTSRVRFLLAAGVFVFIFSTAFLIFHLLSLWILLKFEIIFAGFLMLWYIPIVAVASSIRTARVTLSGDVVVASSWVGFTACFLLIYLVLDAAGWTLPEKDKVEDSVETPPPGHAEQPPAPDTMPSPA